MAESIKDKKVIVITGATGLVGTELCQVLVQAGHTVRSLSRKKNPHTVPGVETFVWDLKRGYIDPAALDGAEVIVHLAGAGIADKRWTKARREEIINSRVQSAQLLATALQQHPNKVSAIVSASGIGYYGYNKQPFLNETAPLAKNNFPAAVCQLWEQAAKDLAGAERRLVIFRIGVVLSNKGGAFPKLILPARLGMGLFMGHGQQMISWIHVKDLAALFAEACTNDRIQGVYNAVAKEPINNINFTKLVGRYMGRFTFPIGIPAWLLQLALGQMSELVLKGVSVSSSRLHEFEYKLRFPHIYECFQQLFRKQKPKE